MAVTGPMATDPGRWELFVYRIARGAVVGLARALWRLEIEGLEKVPPGGAYVVAPVHRSIVDSFAVAGLTKRRLRYMGKDSLWRYRPIGKVLTALGGFPVHRGLADREALRRCEEVIAGGEPLVMFPEGTRKSGPEVMELFEGAVFVAARAGVPILPVGIGGSEEALPKGSRLPRRSKMRMVVGDPIMPPPRSGARVSRSALRSTTSQLHETLQVLFDQAKVGAGPQGWTLR